MHEEEEWKGCKTTRIIVRNGKISGFSVRNGKIGRLSKNRHICRYNKPDHTRRK